MNAKIQKEIDEGLKHQQGFYSSFTTGFGIPHEGFDAPHSVAGKPGVILKDKTERLELAIDDLRIGQRIHCEIKAQGRSVSWLAKQLSMERTSLYYTFRQNTIDLELLIRISFILEHDFLKDVMDMLGKY